MGCGCVSVSYTHLDVYKRQSKDRQALMTLILEHFQSVSITLTSAETVNRTANSTYRWIDVLLEDMYQCRCLDEEKLRMFERSRPMSIAEEVRGIEEGQLIHGK